MAPYKYILSFPVSSGCRPAPISIRGPILPLVLTFPLVGLVTLARIFKTVDLPAPLGPIIPSISPCFKLNVTLSNAQKSSGEGRLKIYPNILLNKNQLSDFCLMIVEHLHYS